MNRKLADKLFGSSLDPVGHEVKIASLPYEVIGVYNPPTGLFGEGDEARAFIPHGALIKYVRYWPGWMDLLVTPEDSVTVERAIDDVTMAMRSMRGLRPRDKNNFDVVTQEKYLQAINSMTLLFKILMVSLSSVGLMVGGIGVVAIMMISDGRGRGDRVPDRGAHTRAGLRADRLRGAGPGRGGHHRRAVRHLPGEQSRPTGSRRSPAVRISR